MARVLVVCTANICRSPMAEALLTREAPRRGEGEVGSAGVWATPGLPASEGSVAAMARAGLDLSAHRSRRTSAQLVDQSDLVVTLESRHLVELVSQHPDALDRVFVLRELVDLVAGSLPEPERPLVARLGELGARRSARDHLGRTDLDVADPIGGSRSQYRRCAAELEQLCGVLAGWMWGPVS